MFVCLFGIASPSSGAARAFRLCRSLSNSRQGSMYLLEPMSAEPTSSLYESVDQPLPSSSASPQCISRLNFEESLIAVVMLMMPWSSDLTKTSDRVFSHSTSPHWSAAKRSSPNKSYRRRTVCLFPDPSSLLPDSATAEPTFVDLSSHRWLRQRRWVSASMVCDCLRLAMVCCMLWTSILIALSTVWQWFCLLPDGLFDCCQTLSRRVCSEKTADDRATLYLSVSRPTACLLPDAWCLLPDSAMEEPTLCLSVVTCQTDHEKGDEYQCPKFATASDSPWYAACHGHPYPSPYLQCDSGYASPHVKIKQRDLKGESHMFKLKEGAEGREPFQFKGGLSGPYWH